MSKEERAAYEAAVEALERMVVAPTPGAVRQARAALARLREVKARRQAELRWAEEDLL